MHRGDRVVFTIQDANNPDQRFQSQHDLIGFFGITSYTFPFPVVADSKNKSYDVKLDVVSPINSTIYVDANSTIKTSYTFSRQSITSSLPSLTQFIFTKFSYSLAETEFVAAIFSFLLPVLLSLLYSIRLKKLLLEFSNVTIQESYLAAITGLLILYNLPFPQLHPLLYVCIILFWVGDIFWHKISSNESFALGLLFLLIMPVYVMLEDISQAERLAAWVFTFLLLAAVQRLFTKENSSD